MTYAKPYKQPSKLKRILTFCIYIVPAMLMLLFWQIRRTLEGDDKDWWLDEHES